MSESCDPLNPRAPARVEFRVADDESARRIEAVLGALGYTPVREVWDSEELLADLVAAAVARFRLTPTEAQVLEHILRDDTVEQISQERDWSLNTARWHSICLLNKLRVKDREHALRVVLHLDGAPPRALVQRATRAHDTTS